jgi:hypothetical protein
MKLKNFIVGLIALMMVSPLFFTSCEEGDEDTSNIDTIVNIDTVRMPAENVFKLDFTANTDPKDTTISVNFVMNMNNLSEVPAIEINDTSVTGNDFGISDMFLTASLSIPYQKSVEYSVSKGDSATEGSIEMPEITEGMVNDSSLFVEDWEIKIPKADSFGVSYQFEGYDYVRIEKSSYAEWGDGNTKYIDDNSYSLMIDTSEADYRDEYQDGYIYRVYLSNLYVSAVKGGTGPLESGLGLTPNVEGNFGNGYVSASTSAHNASVEMVPDALLKSAKETQKTRVGEQPEEETPEVSRKKLIEDYKRLIRNMNY